MVPSKAARVPLNGKGTDMEVYVVSFGDSYDRSVVGVARSLDEARDVARDYLARVYYAAPYLPQEFEYFSVARYVPGVPVGYADENEVRLDLGA